MQKFKWRVGLLCVLGGAIATALVGYWRYSAGARPNVLLITLDTTRADHLGAYGYAKARTPVLDQLAAEGVLFERAYSPAPLTLAVHASLFTGLYPPEHGLRTNGRGSLPTDLTTLAEVLAPAGYDTAAFVASFVLDKKFGVSQGFQTYDDDMSGGKPTQDALHRFRDGGIVVDAALKWLGLLRSRPFFCWVHLYDPHAPYDAHTAEFGDEFAASPYDGEIAYTDRQVGRLLDFLKGQQETIVVVVGDHGEGLGEHVELQHGYTLYNSTQRVPLMIRGVPGAVAGTRVATNVSLVDVLPTLTEVLNVPAPKNISGRSFVDALRDTLIPTRVCYAATDDPFLQNGWSPLRSLTTEKWKYIKTTKPELYDLSSDPHEKKNLAADEPTQLAELEKQLEELEAGMAVREAASVQLTPAEQKALTSLGYVGGKPQPEVAKGELLPDVKDMLPFDAATQAAIDLMDRGKLAEAEAALRKIVAEAPVEHIASRVNLGSVLEMQGKLGEAQKIYEAILKERPEHLDALVHLGGLYADQAQYAEALKLYEKCLEIEPDAPLIHYNMGLAQAKLGLLEEAVTHFQEVVQLDRDFAGARMALGNVLARQGNQVDAVRAYEAELERNPASVETHVNFGVLLGSMQRLDEARQQLEEAVRLAPRNPEAQFNLGVCAGMQGDYQTGVEHLKEAVKLRPEFPGVRTAMGNLLLKQKNKQDAIAAFEDELQHTPNWVDAHINLGALLAGEKRMNEAQVHLEEAVRLAPENADAQFNLGACYGMEGKLQEAVEHLQAALRLNPDHERAAAELARVRKLMNQK